jgi:MFS family permease
MELFLEGKQTHFHLHPHLLILNRVVAVSTLAPSIFSPPPYLFSSSDLGLFALSSFIGIVIAWPIAGPMTDLLSRWMRKRNGNVHQPEHRLPALILPFLVCPVGLIVFGYTVAHQQNYIRPAVGSAISAAGLTLVPSVMLSYVVDAYPRTAGEALVLVNTSKNVVAFGLATGSYSWMESKGVDTMFYEFAGVQWAVLALALPLYLAGPWLRARTQNLF